MPSTRPLLIDTDPGVDDALAILLAFSEPSVRVVALTVCGGNVGLVHTLRNACQLSQRAPYPLPVFAGAALPLLEVAPDAAFVHGSDGFGEAKLAAAQVAAQTEHAALAILRASHEHAGSLEMLCLAPLTNVALALSLDPTLPERVARLTIMGGAVSGLGNITSFAEFNFAVDPEAAKIVTRRWPNYTLVDWEATERHAPSIANSEAWFAAATTNAQFMQQISRKTLAFQQSLNTGLWTWADPLAAYAALYPNALLDSSKVAVEVLTEGAARGASLLDRRRTANARVLGSVDQHDFEAALQRALQAGPAVRALV